MDTLRIVILGRDPELALMADLVAELPSSGGKVVLCRGEAGIGKSALVNEFIQRHGDQAQVHVGFCDDLLTAQPLGPFWDLARDEPALAGPLAVGDIRGVLEAALGLLSRSVHPNVLVIEDTQWAGEATLDAIQYLGRRIARTQGLLILTYRDGEVDQDHPLRRVIGQLPPGNVVRIRLEPLEEGVVASMIGDSGVDLDQLMALTGGNPLFLTEVITAGVDHVPASLEDGILARAAKLTSSARQLLDLVSVVPGEADRTLIEAVSEPSDQDLSECVRQGLLRVSDEKIAFHHELARRAIESTLITRTRRRLNRLVLRAMTGQDDWAEMVHHAVKADDPQSIIELAPRAARAARAAGSHREALAHFRTLEPHLGLLPVTEQAALVSDWARTEHQLDTDRVLSVLDRAILLHRSTGDDRALARMLAFAVRVYEVNGRPEEAEACSIEAVSLLSSPLPSRDLAYALSQRALLKLLKGDDDAQGLDAADRAIAMAEATGDDLTLIRALGVKGAIAHSSNDPAAVELVEDAYQKAVLGGHWYEETYALVNMAGLAADIREVDRAFDLVQKAVQTAARYEMLNLETYARAMLAEILVWKGEWTAAEDVAIEVLGAQPHAGSVAWRMLALLQARTGRSETEGTIERMWALAAASGELQQVDPAASVLAEYMWLSGTMDPENVRRVESALERSLRSGFVWPSGPLAFWMWKLGLLTSVPERVAAPYRQILVGEWRAACEFWAGIGVPYERALALMHGDEAAQLEAIEIFESLGATATARRLRRDLLDKGVRVPRGKAQSTRRHGAGLTARQAEVLAQLAAGLSNAEIADLLFVSHRTVENHVSAILLKLDVPHRVAAVDAARSRGLLAGG